MALKYKCAISRKKIKNILLLFKFLTNLNKTNQETALKFLSNDGIEYVSEGIYNILYNPDCTSCLPKSKQKKIIKTLKPKAKYYQKLSRKKHSVISKRKQILQSGGGLSLLLSTAIPFLASLSLP